MLSAPIQQCGHSTRGALPSQRRAAGAASLVATAIHADVEPSRRRTESAMHVRRVFAKTRLTLRHPSRGPATVRAGAATAQPRTRPIAQHDPDATVDPPAL